MREAFSRPQFGAILVAIALLYFAFSRLLQQWLYPRLGILPAADLFPSFGKLSQPEPLEIPLYLFGYLAIPFLAWTVMQVRERYPKLFRWGLIVGAITATVGVGGAIARWVSHLDIRPSLTYALSQDASHVLWLLFTKRIFITAGLLVLTGVFFLWLIISGRRPGLAWVRQHLDSPRTAFFGLLFFAAIVLLMFHPNFPLDPHHYNFFIGPVNDMLHDKPLLYETTHLYGLLDAYFLALVFQYLLPITYPGIALIVTIFFIVFFTGMYFFLQRWLNSRLLAVAGTAVLIAILYFFQTSPTRSALFFPAMTPLRYGWYLLVLFLLYRFDQTGKRIYEELAVAISTLAFFWVFDHGIFVMAATFLTLLFVKAGQSALSARVVAGLVGRYVVSVLGFVALTSVANVLVYGVWPHWELLFQEAQDQGAGISMQPLPLFGLFEVLIVAYLAVGLQAFQDLRDKRNVDIPLMFLIFYGIFSLIYYVGESTWQTLYMVTGPLILVLFYHFRTHVVASMPGIPWIQRTLTSLFYAFVCFSVFLLVVKLPVEFMGRNYAKVTESFFGLGRGNLSVADEYADALYLRQAYPSLTRLPIVSRQDTPLLVFAGKANSFLKGKHLSNVVFTSQMEELIQEARAQSPPYLFIGRRRNDQIEFFLAQVGSRYERIDTLRTLEVYQLKSKVGSDGDDR